MPILLPILLSAYAGAVLAMLSLLLLILQAAYAGAVLWLTLRSGRRAGPLLAGYGSLLLAVALGALLWPSGAGYVLAIVCLPLVLAPVVLARRLSMALHQGRAAQALRHARRLERLQPWRGWGDAVPMYQVAALQRQGNWTEAAELAARHHDQPPPLGLWMRCQEAAMRGRWQELLELVNQTVPTRPDWQAYFALMRVRALGELGRRVEALQAFALALQRQSGPPDDSFANAYLHLLALAGRPEQARQVLQHLGDTIAPSIASYWLGRALLAAGERREGAALLAPLVGLADPLLQERASEQLVRPPAPPLDPAGAALLDELIAGWQAQRPR